MTPSKDQKLDDTTEHFVASKTEAS